jgi:hypothetical protein
MTRLLILFIFLFSSARAVAQLDLKKSTTLKIKSEQEGLVILELPKKKTTLSPFVLFVRLGKGDFEIIARGKIEGVQEDKILASIERDSIIKYPMPGDVAVTMGSPRDWPKDTDPIVVEPPIQAEPDNEPGDPGYFQLDYGLLKGSLETTASDHRSNEYKDVPSYQMRYLHLVWYFDFLWRFGLEFERRNGSYPTSTYYHNNGDSSDSTTTFFINYRFRKSWLGKRLRPIARLIASNAEFVTLNPDEALITSTMTALGAGVRFSYETDSMLWKPAKGSGFKFLQAYVDANYYPSVSLADTQTVKRGTEGKGAMYEWRVGLSSALYVSWIPWLKRYTLDVGYSERNMNASFSGATANESGSLQPIAEGGSTTEKVKWYYISIGLRFEDAVGQFLKPR